MKISIHKHNSCNLPARRFYTIQALLLLLLIPVLLSGQVAVNTDGSNPAASAILDAKSTEKGFLPPRLTHDERDAIVNPAEGLVIYNRDRKILEMFNGSIWTVLSGGFLCGISQVADADGNTYNTTLIGDQCWMAENLNTGSMIDVTVHSSNNSTIERYCLLNVADSCDQYGGLYKWDEMMAYETDEGAQGICPVGWHIPTYDEWETLVTYLGGWNDASNKLREAGSRHWGNGNTGTNSSGFTALPSGYLYLNTYWNSYEYGYFYTSTENPENTTQAGAYNITNNNVIPIVGADPTYKKNDAMPVRCIKN